MGITLSGQRAPAIGDASGMYAVHERGNSTMAIREPRIESVDWVAVSSAIDQNPHLDNGARIYPDKQTPTDTVARDLVDVRVRVVAPAGTVIYLQAFDADDPNPWVAGQALGDQIDRNDATGSLGGDNLGTTPSNRGAFVGGGTAVAAIVGANGFAVVRFQVTKQPGDNFRIAAAFSQAELARLTDGAPAEGKTVVPAGNAQVGGAGFNGRLSEMLTVWRRLWIERDAMTPPPPTTGSRTVTLSGVTTNVVRGGRPFAVDVLTVNGDLGDVAVFEGGTITLPGFGGKTIPVLTNIDNLIDDEIEVDATSFTAAELAAINAGGVTAIVRDDDDLTILGTAAMPRLVNGGTVLFTAFGDAYILPVYADAFNATPTIPFNENQNDAELLVDLDDAEDMSSTSTFWHTLVVACFQPKQSADGDPDSTPIRMGITVPAEGAITGVSPSNNLSGISYNEAAIYLETLRDLLSAGLGGTDEAHVVTHEIGHSRHPDHTATGLLMEGAPKTVGGSANDHFDNAVLWEFRKTGTW